MCVHYGFDIIPRRILDRIQNDYTDLDCCFIILSCFIDQNIQKYITIEHDDQNKNIELIVGQQTPLSEINLSFKIRIICFF